MVTRERLRELAYADMIRECAMFKELSGEVKVRKASPDELIKYKKMADKDKTMERYDKI